MTGTAMARILIAEDDDSLRHFLARALRRAGHEVMACSTGEAAIGALEVERFAVLLADIVMPGLDGIELARQAGRLDPALRVIFITGFAAVALNRANGALPTAKVLSKPFHLRELVEEIDKALAAPIPEAVRTP
jgi:two-component system, cell cycle response regulator CpdR